MKAHVTDPRLALFAPVRAPIPRALSRTTFARLLIAAVWVNCLATFAYHLTADPLFQQLGNGAAVATVAGCTALAALGGRLFAAKLAGLLLVVVLAAGWWLNQSRTNPIDTIKFFQVFAVFAAARECTGTLRMPRLAYGLALLPLPLLVLGGSRVAGAESWSFLPNANTAALFYTALLFVFSIADPRGKLAAQIVVSILSGKIGVLVASVGAMILAGAVRLRGTGLVLTILGLVMLGPLLMSGMLDRQMEVLGSLIADVYDGGIGSIAQASYADLHLRRGTDLSGYFRIIHWAEILGRWRDAGPGAWLFGQGGGSTPALTTAKLVPHNDYLKVAVEFGIFAFGTFVALIVTAALGIKDRVQRALFLVVAIYFASENLLANFASMALLFGFAGLIRGGRDA